MSLWKQVALGEIAKPVTRPVEVIAGRPYRTIGVKWWGEGAYERQTIDGSQTAARTLSMVHEGDLIINKIWVRHGSTAIASSAVDGCAASGEFPTFNLDSESVLSRWMHWQTKTPSFWDKCDALSRGTSGKNRIKPELFLTIRIPLPPLAEQERIVSRIEHFAANVAEASGLQEEITAEMDALCRSIITNPADEVPTPTDMNELLVMREPDVKVEATGSYHFAGVYCFGRGVFAGHRKNGSEFAYRSLTKIQKGNFVYPKLMAWEGALGVVPENCDGLYVSPEFPVFEVRQDRVLPEVLDTYFRTPSVWPQLAAISTGTNVRRRRLHPKAFLQYKFPLPSMKVQRQLSVVRLSIEQTKRKQSESAAELDALMPSILSKAFRGEL
jgi:type I restriction enzyme, S subunit